jgi:hypothetical protein
MPEIVSDEEWSRRLAAALEKLDRGTREDFEERAGILEFDAGRTRREAERLAWDIVIGTRK